jgi:hypothetical protein
VTAQELAWLEALYGGLVPPGAAPPRAASAPAGVPTMWGWVAVVLLGALLFFWGTVETVVRDAAEAVEAGVRAAAEVARSAAEAPARAAEGLGEAVRSA